MINPKMIFTLKRNNYFFAIFMIVVLAITVIMSLQEYRWYNIVSDSLRETEEFNQRQTNQNNFRYSIDSIRRISTHSQRYQHYKALLRGQTNKKRQASLNFIMARDCYNIGDYELSQNHFESIPEYFPTRKL